MLIKLTYPLTIGERVYLPGEIIDVAEVKALKLLTNELAIEVAEVKKNGNRKNRKQVH
jgi:hypothetical protein